MQKKDEKPPLLYLLQFGLHKNRTPYVKWPESIEAIKGKIKEIMPEMDDDTLQVVATGVTIKAREYIKKHGVTMVAAAAQLVREAMHMPPSIMEDDDQSVSQQ